MLIDQDGTTVGIVDILEAMKRAKAVNLDLVEIAPKATPPVCKILDYGQMIYNEQKRVAEAKKLGFKTCIVPAVALKSIGKVDGIEVIGVNSVNQAMNYI